MDSTDLEALLAHLRSLGNDHSTCEVKRAQGGLPATVWETLSAFANAQGGTLILGVDEKQGFSVVGVRDPGQIESQLGAVCEDLEPKVRADIQTIAIEGKHVVVAEIPPTPRDQRPCHKRSLGPWAGSRYRVADGDRKLTDYEVSVLLANRTEQRFDVAPVAHASPDDLDATALTGFLNRIREIKGSIFTRMGDLECLKMLNVLTAHEGRLVPTLAGLLAFGLYPQRYEPQLNVTIVAYPNSDPAIPGSRGERFIENRSVDGSIPHMVIESIKVLKRNMRRRSIVTGIFRTDEWEYPEEVLREALVNALVHRDYSEHARGMQVQVELYPDRLIIRNPGGLYGPVTLSALGTSTISSSRNRALLKILEDTPMGDGHMVCENRGTGIARMRYALTQAGMEPPTFVDDIGIFEAEFPNHTLLDQEALDWLTSLSDKPLTRSQMTALVMMRNGRTLTNSSFRAATGVMDSRAASKELKELVERGIIEQIGTRGSTVYRLVEPADTLQLETEEPSEQNAHAKSIIERLTPLQKAVYEALGTESLSRGELAEKTKLTPKKVINILTTLRGKGLVQMEGQPRSKSARWRRSVNGE